MRSLSTVEKENVEFLYFMNETTNVAMNEDIFVIYYRNTYNNLIYPDSKGSTLLPVVVYNYSQFICFLYLCYFFSCSDSLVLVDS